MDKVVLRKTLSLIWRLLVLYSVYILLRGHNEPGGGFIGGLVLALGVILRSYITQDRIWEELLASRVRWVMGLYLLMFIATVLFPVLIGKTVLQGVWSAVWLPIAGKFSSILVFDVIVYIVVASSAVYAHYVLNLSLKGHER